MDDDPADASPTRGTRAVGRSTVAPRARGAARYGPRQRRADDAAEAEAPPAGRAAVEPDEDEEINDGRRGRFIETTGWGRSADTSAWKLAATDDRLYRRPDAARRSRDGDGTRRGRAPVNIGGQRRSARQRAEPGRGPRGRSEPEGRERDRIIEPEGRSPASGQDTWQRRGSDGAGDRRSPRSEPPADRPIRSGPRTGTERPVASLGRDAGRTAPTSGAAGWKDAPTSSAGWGRTADTGQWDGGTETGRWDGATETGQWDGATDTGQWDRFTDTTEWRRDDLPGLLQRDDEDGGPWQDSGKTFWSGTRLAGDDPRWMETPDSAPRSPVAAYSAPPRARQAPPERPARAVGAARTTGTARVASSTQATATRLAAPAPRGQSTYPARRGLEAMPTSWRTRRIEDDLLDADPGSPLSAVLYTAAWYAVPVLVFFVWLLTLDGSVPAGCVTDVAGVGCDSDRAKATASLLSAAPRFGLALMVSLVVAVLLRWASGTWRSGSVGLAAAVVGGGLSTVLISVISGQSLG
jgi:hypothetical protein